MQWAHTVSKENTKRTCDFSPPHNSQAMDSDDHIDAHIDHSLHNAWPEEVVTLHNIHSAAV